MKKMKSLPENKLMSIQEVASILGVTPEAIRIHTRRLYPGYIENGRTTFLSEEMVFAIKKEMKPSSSLEGARTELEMKKMTLEVIHWLEHENNDLKNALTNIENSIQIPLGFNIPDGCIQLNTVAKILNFNIGRNILFQILRDAKILMSGKKHNEPYQKFITKDYFRLIPTLNSNRNIWMITTYVTPKGLIWLKKYLNYILIRS